MYNKLTNIISKLQIHEIITQNSVSQELFAKTVSYSGIQNKFHIDSPEIISYEKNLEERQNDIKKFTRLAMSNPTNTSHNDLVKELYKKSDFYNSTYENQLLHELVNNKNLLSDLGL